MLARFVTVQTARITQYHRTRQKVELHRTMRHRKINRVMRARDVTPIRFSEHVHSAEIQHLASHGECEVELPFVANLDISLTYIYRVIHRRGRRPIVSTDSRVLDLSVEAQPGSWLDADV